MLDPRTFAIVVEVEATGIQELLGTDESGHIVAQTARGITLFHPADLAVVSSHDAGRIVAAAALVGRRAVALSFSPSSQAVFR